MNKNCHGTATAAALEHVFFVSFLALFLHAHSTPFVRCAALPWPSEAKRSKGTRGRLAFLIRLAINTPTGLEVQPPPCMPWLSLALHQNCFSSVPRRAHEFGTRTCMRALD